MGEAGRTPAMPTWLQRHTSTQGAQANLALQVFYFAALSSDVVRSDCPLFATSAAGIDTGDTIDKLCMRLCKHALLATSLLEPGLDDVVQHVTWLLAPCHHACTQQH